MTKTDKELLKQIVDRLYLLGSCKLKLQSVRAVMEKLDYVNEVKPVIKDIVMGKGELNDEEAVLFETNLNELAAEKTPYSVEKMVDKGWLQNGDIYKAYTKLGILDKIKEYEKGKPGLFDNLFDKYGVAKKAKSAALALIVFSAAIYGGSLLTRPSKVGGGKEVIAYKGVDKTNWAIVENREKHVENISHLCNLFRDSFDIGNKEGVKKYTKMIDKYFADIKMNDPEFGNKNPGLYKRLLQLEKEYKSLK